MSRNKSRKGDDGNTRLQDKSISIGEARDFLLAHERLMFVPAPETPKSSGLPWTVSKEQQPVVLRLVSDNTTPKPEPHEDEGEQSAEYQFWLTAPRARVVEESEAEPFQLTWRMKVPTRLESKEDLDRLERENPPSEQFHVLADDGKAGYWHRRIFIGAVFLLFSPLFYYFCFSAGALRPF